MSSYRGLSDQRKGLGLMNSTLNADTVRLAYRLLLDREAESDQAILDHLALGSLENVRSAMMASDEFKGKILQSHFTESKWVAVDVLDRFIMWVDLHDRYVSHGCLNNNWEPEESSLFYTRLREGDTVLDIGANIGWFTLLAAKAIGPHGQIHAFEPRPVTAKMLARTIAQNNLRSVVQVWQYVLSHAPGDVFLTWATNTENPGNSFVTKNPSFDYADHEKVSVRAVRLDDLLPDVAPDIIKIDVEGAEPMVFAGAKNALRRKKPLILSELYPEQLARVSSKTATQYISQMEELGYACYLLDKGYPTDRLRDFPKKHNKELASVIFEWRGA